MNSRLPILAFFLLASASACAPATEQQPNEVEATESTESDLSATGGRGVLATDMTNYALNRPNAARELEELGIAEIPGVLSASSSTSPYMHAGRLDLAAWSDVSTTSFDGASGSALYVRAQGKPTSRAGKVAKKIYDAMSNVPAVAENGAFVRRSSKGSVTCASYTDGHHQCFLGPFGHVASR
jgi:hypothetical protein